MQHIGGTANRFTPGERQLALAYLVVMAFGAILSFLIVLRLGQGRFVFQGHRAYGLWICLSGAIGAAVGLHVAQGRLGHPGMAGALQAATGMILLCFAASLIGGTLALPLYGTMFGPFMLAVTLAASPLLALTWFSTLTAVHLMLLRWRAERDSIFAAAQPAPGMVRKGVLSVAINPRRGSSGLP